MSQSKTGYGYARTATVVQSGEPNSIERQVQEIDKYCSENNIKLMGTFTDCAKSGADMNRPAIQDLIQQLKKTQVNCIVALDSSRIVRNELEYIAFKKLLSEHGLSLKFVHGGIEEDSPYESFFDSVLSAVNAFNAGVYPSIKK